MGLLTSMASLFLHIDSTKKELIREEVSLTEAINAHVSWKFRLQNYLDGKSVENLDPMIICRDDQCKLGIWIHGPALNHFHDFEPFHQLRTDHSQFHVVAADIVKHVHANDRESAEKILRGEYQYISHKIVMALTELNSLVTSAPGFRGD